MTDVLGGGRLCMGLEQSPMLATGQAQCSLWVLLKSHQAHYVSGWQYTASVGWTHGVINRSEIPLTKEVTYT